MTKELLDRVDNVLHSLGERLFAGPGPSQKDIDGISDDVSAHLSTFEQHDLANQEAYRTQLVRRLKESLYVAADFVIPSFDERQSVVQRLRLVADREGPDGTAKRMPYTIHGRTPLIYNPSEKDTTWQDCLEVEEARLNQERKECYGLWKEIKLLDQTLEAIEKGGAAGAPATSTCTPSTPLSISDLSDPAEALRRIPDNSIPEGYFDSKAKWPPLGGWVLYRAAEFLKVWTGERAAKLTDVASHIAACMGEEKEAAEKEAATNDINVTASHPQDADSIPKEPSDVGRYILRKGINPIDFDRRRLWEVLNDDRWAKAVEERLGEWWSEISRTERRGSPG